MKDPQNDKNFFENRYVHKIKTKNPQTSYQKKIKNQIAQSFKKKFEDP
jgi:hypothetical protein